MVAKSTWEPAIRREHALAGQAERHGVRVDFVEAPADLRTLRRAGWAAGLRAVPPLRTRSAGTSYARSTLVPGHRHPLAAAVDNRLLHRTLRALCDVPGRNDAVIVVNTPWQWGATAGVRARRVFDAADDWNLLLDGRRPHVRRAYRRIAEEADAVVVANESLSSLFPGRQVRLVPNGTPAGLIAGAAARTPGSRRMAYVGTLTERFDAHLVGRVLALLPGWSLDLYGEARYAGHGDRPAPELVGLLETYGARVSWHGVRQRSELGAALDRADVALVPHRARYCRGQSSMKFLDYAARGCPVVSTRWAAGLDRQAPPGVRFADTAQAFADAVRAAGDVDAATAGRAISWARTQTWEQRWPRWEAAVFGEPTNSTIRQQRSDACDRTSFS